MFDWVDLLGAWQTYVQKGLIKASILSLFSFATALLIPQAGSGHGTVAALRAAYLHPHCLLSLGVKALFTEPQCSAL